MSKSTITAVRPKEESLAILRAETLLDRMLSTYPGWQVPNYTAVLRVVGECNSEDLVKQDHLVTQIVLFAAFGRLPELPTP